MIHAVSIRLMIDVLWIYTVHNTCAIGAIHNKCTMATFHAVATESII